MTVKNYEPDVLMGPADVDSWQVTDADTTDSKKTVEIELHPTVAQRDFKASFQPSKWDSSSYDASWDQAQVGVDARVMLQTNEFPKGSTLASSLDGARLNTDAQAFTVPRKSADGALVFDVAAPHCKVGAADDGTPATCDSAHVNDDGFYEAVIPSGYVTNVWGDVDADSLRVVAEDDGTSTTLQSVTITERASGAISIQATDIHYSNPSLKIEPKSTSTTTPVDTNDPPRASVADVETVRAGDRVTLDASDSADTDGSVASYDWESHRFNDGVELRNASSARASFVAPAVDATETLYFELEVTDDEGETDSRTVALTVKPSTTESTDAAATDAANATATDATATDAGSAASDAGEWTDTDGDGSLDVDPASFEERYPNLDYEVWAFLFD